jgi:shikimate dehydrogenase
LGKLLDATQRVAFAGLNVTFPFKQVVIPLLDDLSEAAAAIGAVNTVSFRGGRRTGHNTDVTGFAAGFRDGLPGVAPGTVLQIGCGGAGSATAHALLDNLGAEKVILFDTEAPRLAVLHEQLCDRYGAERVGTCVRVEDGAAQADGILNATPVGMAKFPGLPITAAAIEQRHWVADVVYFPLETALLAEARRKGCRTLDGSGMAVHQAAEAFTIFTGLPTDVARMRASFAKFVSDRSRAAAA